MSKVEAKATSQLVNVSISLIFHVTHNLNKQHICCMAYSYTNDFHLLLLMHLELILVFFSSCIFLIFVQLEEDSLSRVFR
jgi:hypothetical protein